MVSVCVCAVSVCLQMHVQIFAAIFSPAESRNMQEDLALKVKNVCIQVQQKPVYLAQHTIRHLNSAMQPKKRSNSWLWDDIKGKTAVKKTTTKKMGLHPPLCTSCNHSTVNFKQQYQKGPLSKPPDFLSHLFSPPSHLSALIHFNYASSHFS